jgi:hypothetical protein
VTADLPILAHLPGTAQRGLVALDGRAVEVAVDHPPAGTARAGLALIAHPHPLFGGTMDNKVVTTLERSLRELGLATLRFNFRGVGRSDGSHDDGRGETEDLVALAGWLRAQRPGHALWLAGFSFGSWVSLRAAARLAPAQLVSIAPPVGRWSFEDIARPAAPWLIVQGEADEVVAPQAVYDFVAAQTPPPELIRMPETSHFFHGKLTDLRALLQAALGAHAAALAPA